MRLDRYLSETGAFTRSQVKELVKKKKIRIAGVKQVKADTQVDYGQEVFVSDEPFILSEFEYYMLNKPAGYLSATEDRRKPVIMELIPSKRKDLVPVGRLDEDTEGLILVTNDGELNHRLLSPKNHVRKTYYAELSADLPENAEVLLSEPIEFEEFTSLPGELQVISKRSAYLTITEGKFHQVKRMFAHIGCDVIYLKRVKFGPLTLPSDLQISEARALTSDEVSVLQAHGKNA